MSTFNVRGDNKDRPDLTTIAMRYKSDKGLVDAGAHPAHKYTYIYDKYLSPIRDEKIRILEIGVFDGQSLRMWEDYFPNAEITAIDIDPRCAEFASERSRVFIGDGTDMDFIRREVFSQVGDMFDVIIDDGSHRNDHIIMSLENLFPHLKYGGYYFIEDYIVTTIVGKWWHRPYKGFRDFFDFIAYLHREQHFSGEATSGEYEPGDERIRRLYLDPSKQGCSIWNESLYGVSVYTNLCVLERQNRMTRIAPPAP